MASEISNNTIKSAILTTYYHKCFFSSILDSEMPSGRQKNDLTRYKAACRRTGGGSPPEPIHPESDYILRE